LIPRPPAALAKCPVEQHGGSMQSAAETHGSTPWLPGLSAATKPHGSSKPELTLPLLAPHAPGVAAGPDVERFAPNIISVRRWAELLDGKLLATSPRVDRATLLRRTYDVDVIQQPDGRAGGTC
jgi:hypothetical protein